MKMSNLAHRRPSLGSYRRLRVLRSRPIGSNAMPTIEQCRTYAAEYKILATDQQISARRTSVLSSISRSWTALAHQLESLTVIVKDEGK